VRVSAKTQAANPPQRPIAAVQNTVNEISSNQRICVATSSNIAEYGAAEPDAQEVTMPAIAEIPSTGAPQIASHENNRREKNRRGSDRTACPVCADSMIAAEASAFVAENLVSYLWTCDTCGYGFVTNHSLKRFVAA
jgi:hypothetical protein